MFIAANIPALTMTIMQLITIIGTAVTVIFTVLLISWNYNKQFNSKASKEELVDGLKEEKKEREKTNEDMKLQLQTICADNTRSHGEIRAENDKYLSMVQHEMETDRIATDKKLDLILQVVNQIKDKK